METGQVLITDHSNRASRVKGDMVILSMGALIWIIWVIIILKEHYYINQFINETVRNQSKRLKMMFLITFALWPNTYPTDIWLIFI